MPHESTVDPEEPMHFRSWGDETSHSDSSDHRRSIYGQPTATTPRTNRSLSIQTHPDLPLYVTHDHDDDPDDATPSFDQGEDIEIGSNTTYTPPKRKIQPTSNGEKNEK